MLIVIVYPLSSGACNFPRSFQRISVAFGREVGSELMGELELLVDGNGLLELGKNTDIFVSSAGKVITLLTK